MALTAKRVRFVGIFKRKWKGEEGEKFVLLNGKGEEGRKGGAEKAGEVSHEL